MPTLASSTKRREPPPWWTRLLNASCPSQSAPAGIESRSETIKNAEFAIFVGRYLRFCPNIPFDIGGFYRPAVLGQLFTNYLDPKGMNVLWGH